MLDPRPCFQTTLPARDIHRLRTTNSNAKPVCTKIIISFSSMQHHRFRLCLPKPALPSYVCYVCIAGSLKPSPSISYRSLPTHAKNYKAPVCNLARESDKNGGRIINHYLDSNGYLFMMNFFFRIFYLAITIFFNML